MVLRADAVTSAAYIITVNRPSSAEASPIGAPSAVIDPDGEILIETTDSIAVVRLEPEAVARAREAYPGYLEFQPEVHEKGWKAAVSRKSTGEAGDNTV